MDIVQIRDWSTWFAEWVIVVILWIEFLYDRNWNEHLKRQKRKQKDKLSFENLTDGEGR